jgi:broad specificity phosphatase PhoE
MTRVILIKAGPTRWDVEQRISGNLPLPLTEEARANLVPLIQSLPPVDAVYHCQHNEACDEVAKMVAKAHEIKPRDNEALEGWCLGLWQGMRLEDLRQRYPTAIEQWEESPSTVVPPEGETLLEAIARLRDAVKKILKRNRGYTIALVLRPSAMQMVAGILRRQTPEQIAAHLQNDAAMETIELQDDLLKQM